MNAKYTQDTLDFLETMLFAHCWECSELKEEDVTIWDIEESSARDIENFLCGFENHLAENFPETSDKLGDLQRSFGGNVFFSLSGHGCGFFDEQDSELSELQSILIDFAGDKYKFEQIELTSNSSGSISIS